MCNSKNNKIRPTHSGLTIECDDNSEHEISNPKLRDDDQTTYEEDHLPETITEEEGLKDEYDDMDEEELRRELEEGYEYLDCYPFEYVKERFNEREEW